MNQDEKEPVQKILIAEDNREIRHLMKKFFIKAKQRGDINCKVLEVSDGEQAIRVLSEQKPDLVLCDIHMPKLDGYEVLDYFNGVYIHSEPFCFFAFLTGSEEEKQKAYAENVMGFISKYEVSYNVLCQQAKIWLRLAKLERILESKSE